jgi:hypothetical protein
MGIDRIFSHRQSDSPSPAFDLDRETGEFVGWHVTDHPIRLAEFLSGKGDLRTMGAETDDLGRGLYVSAQPQIWLNRSRSKWDFLPRLDEAGRRRLCDCLRKDPVLIEGHGLTSSEKQSAEATLVAVADGKYSTSALVSLLANQPYNISFGSPDWLSRHDFTPGPQPALMEIRWRGTMAMLDQSPAAEELADLGRVHAGAAIRNGFGSTAQAVLWKSETITRWQVARDLMRTLGLTPEIPRVPRIPAVILTSGADQSAVIGR